MARRIYRQDELCDLLSPQRVSEHLGGREVARISGKIAPKRSAVAAILRHRERGPEVLLMQRIERPGDRWSGQISLPGGMAQWDDRDALATAVRETMEEVGVDLDAAATRLGRMDDQMAIARGKRLPMAIEPFVFALTRPTPLQAGPEAQEAFWMPLLPVVNGENDAIKEWRMAGLRMRFPAWSVRGHLVWGLTHNMISSLLETAGIAMPPRPKR